MARRQRHLVDVGRIPGGDDQAAGIRIAPDHVHHIGDLVDGAAVLRRPGAPLPAVDRAEVAVFVGPFVPDPHAVVVEIFDVGVAGQKPQQLVDDRLDVQLLGGGERKARRRDRSASDGRTRTTCRCRCGRASRRRRRARVPSVQDIAAWLGPDARDFSAGKFSAGARRREAVVHPLYSFAPDAKGRPATASAFCTVSTGRRDFSSRARPP